MIGGFSNLDTGLSIAVDSKFFNNVRILLYTRSRELINIEIPVVIDIDWIMFIERTIC